MRGLVRQSAGYAIGTIGARAIPFLALPVVLRTLSPAEFGRLELALSLSSLLSALVGLGVIKGVYRYFALTTADDDRRRLVAVAVTFTAVSGALIAVLLVTVRSRLASVLFNDPHQSLLVAVVMIRMPLDAMAEFGRDIFRLERQIRTYSVVLLFEAVVGVGAAVALLHFAGGGAVTYMSALTVASALSVGYSSFKLRKWYSAQWDWRILSELLRFGLPLGLQAVAVYTYSYSDRAFLAHVRSLAVVGEYALASKITVLPLLIAGSFGRAWHPYYLSMDATAPIDETRKFIARCATSTVAAFALLSLFTALTAPLLLRLIAPDSYAGAVLPVAALSLAVTFQVSQEFTFIGLVLGNRPGLAAIIRVSGAVVNTALNVALIPRFGAIGAAWSTAISFAAISVLAFIASQRTWPIPFETWKIIAAVFTATALTFIIGTVVATAVTTSAIIGLAIFGAAIGAIGTVTLLRTKATLA